VISLPFQEEETIHTWLLAVFGAATCILSCCCAFSPSSAYSNSSSVDRSPQWQQQKLTKQRPARTIYRARNICCESATKVTEYKQISYVDKQIPRSMLPPWWVSLSICHKSYCSLLSHLEYVPLSKQLLANMTSPIKLEVNRVDRRTEQQIWWRLETMLQRYTHGQTNTQTNEHTCSMQYSTPVPGAGGM